MQYLMHYGVKGMHWGVRKDHDSRRAKKLKRISKKNPRVLSIRGVARHISYSSIAASAATAVGSYYMYKKISGEFRRSPLSLSKIAKTGKDIADAKRFVSKMSMYGLAAGGAYSVYGSVRGDIARSKLRRESRR